MLNILATLLFILWLLNRKELSFLTEKPIRNFKYYNNKLMERLYNRKSVFIIIFDFYNTIRITVVEWISKITSFLFFYVFIMLISKIATVLFK